MDLLAGNETIKYHPWFGASEVAGYGHSPNMHLLKPAKKKIRILLMGCAEKPGAPGSLHYLRNILYYLPDASEYDIEIVGNDISFQERIHQFNSEGVYIGERDTEFKFDASGRYRLSPNITLVKIDSTNPAENLLSESFNPAEQYDVVINSRITVQYGDAVSSTYVVLTGFNVIVAAMVISKFNEDIFEIDNSLNIISGIALAFNVMAFSINLYDMYKSPHFKKARLEIGRGHVTKGMLTFFTDFMKPVFK